jgi:hypothetical protein
MKIIYKQLARDIISKHNSRFMSNLNKKKLNKKTIKPI